MKKRLLLIFLFPLFALGQTPDFSQHIAPIVYQHCTSCHRPGEIGPMPFTSYSEVSAYGNTIKSVTQSRYMPPWKPDPNYRHFVDENVLSASEIQLIKDWVDGGMPQGNPALEPPLPNFPTGSQIGTPDLVIPMAQSFTQTGNNQDLYRVFVLPTNLTTNKNLRAVEFRAGNKKICHHAIIAIDTTQQSSVLDANSPGYGYTQFGGFGFQPAEPFLSGWAPGMSPKVYPSGIGKTIWKNSKLLLQMHYAPSAVDETDSSWINLFYAQGTVSRQASITPITPNNLVNGPFFIPANTVKTFHGKYTLPIAISFLNILPHGHLLCKSWEAYAVKPTGDTVKLIKINNWDFNYQGQYSFQQIQVLPAGSVLHVYATYDNTSSNPRNPHSPPQNVSWGESTLDEMYLFYMNWVPYNTGDENIVLGESSPTPGILLPKDKLSPIYPNPMRGMVKIGFSVSGQSAVTIQLLDLRGRFQRTLFSEEKAMPGYQQISLNTEDLPSGTYLVEMTSGNHRSTEKLIVP